MEPRDPGEDPTPAGEPSAGEIDLAAVGLAVFFLSLIAIVAGLLLVPALT